MPHPLADDGDDLDRFEPESHRNNSHERVEASQTLEDAILIVAANSYLQLTRQHR